MIIIRNILDQISPTVMGNFQIKYQVPLQSGKYRVSSHLNAEQEYSCSDIAAYIVVTNYTALSGMNTPLNTRK
jgi:hypothetical protein